MKKVLISLISDQPVPNYLLIKELKNIDKYIFISTSEMEKKGITKNIYSTAQISEEKRIEIVASNENLDEIKNRLNKLNFTNDDEYYVNLTGGTKIMSIAIWDFFNKFSKSKFFYFPISKNSYKEINHNGEDVEYSVSYKLSVKEYLSIYGIGFIQDIVIFNEQQIDDIFKDVRSTKFNLDKFPKNKLKKFDIKNYRIQQVHTKWFEEYIYFKIKNALSLTDEFIKTGIKIYFLDNNKNTRFSQNDNELDIFFIYKNIPFIIETKFSIGIENNSRSIYSYLYKLSSINKYFGLRAKSVIMTLSTFENSGQNCIDRLKRRCQLLNVHFPFDRNKIIFDSTFKYELKNFCN